MTRDAHELWNKAESAAADILRAYRDRTLGKSDLAAMTITKEPRPPLDHQRSSTPSDFDCWLGDIGILLRHCNEQIDPAAAQVIRMRLAMRDRDGKWFTPRWSLIAEAVNRDPQTCRRIHTDAVAMFFTECLVRGISRDFKAVAA